MDVVFAQVVFQHVDVDKKYMLCNISGVGDVIVGLYDLQTMYFLSTYKYNIHSMSTMHTYTKHLVVQIQHLDIHNIQQYIYMM